jgi:hypothetical protein
VYFYSYKSSFDVHTALKFDVILANKSSIHCAYVLAEL